MNKQELVSKIDALKATADTLEEPDKTFTHSDIRQLEIQLLGLSTTEIAVILNTITLPDIRDMDTCLRDAQNASIAHEQRVEFLNLAIGFIQRLLPF